MIEPRPGERERLLVFRSGIVHGGLPLTQIVEIMRPQPLQPIASAPSFVEGVALIRLAPTPVVSMARLLDPLANERARRLITVRVERRIVALSVAEVIGIRQIPAAQASSFPPLLSGGSEAAIATLGALDHGLLLVLRLGTVIPEACWAGLSHAAP